MLNRREFIGTGLGALAAGALSHPVLGTMHGALGRAAGGARPVSTAPLLTLDALSPPTIIDGIPFDSLKWSGDVWTYETMPFHHTENGYPGGSIPPPVEEADVAIVGGGLSGLMTAYLLREHGPIVFEMADRFGGVSKGEVWKGIPYSMGGAYFINPDPGSELESLYRSLGFDRTHRLSSGTDPVELNGSIIEDIYADPNLAPEERDAMARYRAIVIDFAENHYPDIPLDEQADNQWILDLDRKSFKADVEMRLGGPVPPILTALIQGYFYSSFNAGWEEISAAAGWNFVAAEEYGRWVLPGGNAGFVQALYERLLKPVERLSGQHPPPARAPSLRASTRVVEVLPADHGRLLVVTRQGGQGYKSVLTKRVVFCCPKPPARRILERLLPSDNAWMQASHAVGTNAYVVVNLLLSTPIGRDFYDLFALWDGNYPVDSAGAEGWSRITDVINGSYARPPGAQSVLTCYWPLPFPTSRFTLLEAGTWERYAQAAAPRIRELMQSLGLPMSALVQARLARWGHAFPLSRVGFLADGTWRRLRESPYPGVFSVGQDNWALPAVETCLLDAIAMAPRIARGL